MDLADFLLARIAEDEAKFAVDPDELAAALRPAPNPMWQNDDAYVVLLHARVLAECEARRRIVATHYIEGNSGMHECPYERGGEPLWTPHEDDQPEWRWCSTLRLLALPYADHESYREEWKP